MGAEAGSHTKGGPRQEEVLSFIASTGRSEMDDYSFFFTCRRGNIGSGDFKNAPQSGRVLHVDPRGWNPSGDVFYIGIYPH